MDAISTPEGALALAVAALCIVLGWRFALPERGRDVLAALAFVVAVAIGFAAARGLLPDLAPGWAPGWRAPGLAARLAGGALLVLGLLLAGGSHRARLEAGRGRLATAGPYARLRHPLYLGLALVLLGLLLRQPTLAGALAAVLVAALFAWAAALDERAASRTFGDAWRAYAARTGAIVPRI